jgi:hypothetical protein
MNDLIDEFENVCKQLKGGNDDKLVAKFIIDSKEIIIIKLWLAIIKLRGIPIEFKEANFTSLATIYNSNSEVTSYTDLLDIINYTSDLKSLELILYEMSRSAETIINLKTKGYTVKFNFQIL